MILVFIPFFLGFEEIFIEKITQRMAKNRQDIFTNTLAQRVMNEIINPEYQSINKEFCQMVLNRLILNNRIYYQDNKKQNLHVFGYINSN